MKHLLSILLVFVLAFFNNCTSKKLSESKRALKKIDTLLVMSPVLNLHCVNLEMDDLDYDTLLMNKISKNIINTYQELLDSKYVLTVSKQKNIKPDSITLSAIIPLLQKLEASDKEHKSIEMDSCLYNINSPEKNRYQLFTYLEGGYRSKKKIKSNKAVMIPLLVATSILTGGAQFIFAGRYSNFIFYQFVYDRKENKVLYHCRSGKCQENIWEKETIVLLTKTMSKRIYYK